MLSFIFNFAILKNAFTILTYVLLFVQAVEAFTMLYENNYPMRFGVILLSGNVLEKIVANGEDIISVESDGVSKDKNSETDLSLLVYMSSSVFLIVALFFSLQFL